jgi:hypothetical protein
MDDGEVRPPTSRAVRSAATAPWLAGSGTVLVFFFLRRRWTRQTGDVGSTRSTGHSLVPTPHTLARPQEHRTRTDVGSPPQIPATDGRRRTGREVVRLQVGHGDRVQCTGRGESRIQRDKSALLSFVGVV